MTRRYVSHPMRPLIDALCDDSAGSDRAQLESALLDEPAAQWLYLQMMNLHATLKWNALTAGSCQQEPVHGRL